LTKQVREMSKMLPETDDAHAKTKWQAEKAKILATQGEMDAANLVAVEAKNEFNKVKRVSDNLAVALDTARVLFTDFQLRVAII